MLGAFATSAEFSGFSMGHFVGQEGLLAMRFVISPLGREVATERMGYSQANKPYGCNLAWAGPLFKSAYFGWLAI
jgi:hypothetical protein